MELTLSCRLLKGLSTRSRACGRHGGLSCNSLSLRSLSLTSSTSSNYQQHYNSSKYFSTSMSSSAFLRNNNNINHLRTSLKLFSTNRSENNGDGNNLSDTITSGRYMDKIYTIPNMITMSRILLCPFLYYAIESDMKSIALAGVGYCAFTDWLDGFIAKKYDMSSRFGAFLDPLADKIFIATMTIGLAAQNVIPYPLVTLIVLRDVILFSGVFYLRLKNMPKGAPIFDTTSTATFEIIPSNLSKLNTMCQFACIILGMSHFSSGYPLIEQLEPLYWTTGLTTLASGISYMDGKGMANNNRSNSKYKKLFNFFGKQNEDK